MKLCYIVPRFVGPYGGERHVLHYASELGNTDNDIVIYTHKFSPDCYPLVTSQNVKVIETGLPKIKSHDTEVILSYLFTPILASRIRGKFDLIQIWGPEGVVTGFILKKILRRYSQTPILLLTGEPPRFAYDLVNETLAGKGFMLKTGLRMAVPFIRYLDKISVRNMDNITVNNDWVAEQFKEIYGKDCKVVYPGVEIDRFNQYSKHEARTELGLNQNSTIYLSVSKLHARKRLDEALKIYQEHCKDAVTADFFILGDGPEENNLKKLTKELNIKNVHFMGRLSDNEVALYYQAADYFIFTAKNEPYGIAPMEAKVAGCQLIPEDRLSPIISWEESTNQILKVYQELVK